MTTCSGSDRNWLSRRLATLAVGIGVCILGGAATPAQAVCQGGTPNGVVEAGEACDDGNSFATDGCTNACALQPNSCMDDITPGNLNCTANDVNLGLLVEIIESDGCDFLGDTAQVQMQGHLRATAAERYDIGFFIALDGGTAQTGACHHNYLPPPLAGAGAYDPGNPILGNGGGPFFDAEISEDPADSCGDLEQQVSNFYDLQDYSFSGSLQTLTIKCVDNDNNGLVDIGSCVSWDNGKSRGTKSAPSCVNVAETIPSTPAKCRCETLNTNLVIRGKIIVDKITDPSPDPTATSFDFDLTGGPGNVDIDFDLTDAAAPFQQFLAPGVYSVVENVPPGWDLASAICSDGSPANAIVLGSNETVTCTFTDEDLCIPSECDDDNVCTEDTCSEAGACVNTPTPGTACGDGSDGVCDNPDSCDASGQCQPNYETPTTICRPGSGDLCDPDESCDGAGACPADVVTPSTTTCRPGSGDSCDPDESCTGTAGQACPADVVTPSTTTCRPGSGDSCDPDESCTGTAGQACPADVVTPSTTTCRPGSGDSCDPDESCTGTAGQACPADVVTPSTTTCRPGSGDSCDPDESCTGTAGQACPADVVTPSTTTCRPGSGDSCDPDESCTGTAGQACPADVVTPSTTTCRPGSGDSCDPDESCTGTAGQACPADVVTPSTTTCRPGSGDSCDPDESCTGTAGQACPADVVTPSTTTCRPGSGDSCDPDESCTGTAGQACPADVVTPSTTTCRPGSGDSCDPDESCTGTAGQACPADVVTPSTTTCRPGSGDSCDPDESCTGTAGQACPADVVTPSTTTCRPGSGDSCDPDESCTGTAGQACPADVVTPSTTTCRPGSGDSCDPDESCTGTAGQACPADVVTPSTTTCRTGSGDLCDPDESCTGTAGQACPADFVAPLTTICNPGSGDACDPDESCTGEPGIACGPDIVAEPTTICNPSATECDVPESCTGNADATCPVDNPGPPQCNQLTDTSYCPLPNDQFRLLLIGEPCVNGGGSTVLNSYRLNATNPGQFYYNVFDAGTPGDPVTLDVTIPYPFVTQGAVPIQTHDSFDVVDSCFVPSPNLNSQYTISCDGGNLSPSGNPVVVLGDYPETDIDPLNVTQCTVSGVIPATGVLYVTVHLDYGLESRTPAWMLGGADNNDALSASCGVPTGATTIEDPQPYTFSYANGSSGSTEPESFNVWKKNPGINGLTLQGGTGNPKGNTRVELWGPTNKFILAQVTDEDGFFILQHKHTGKAATYTVKLPAYGLIKQVTLKANGYSVVTFETLP